jgi:hypothetical protein
MNFTRSPELCDQSDDVMVFVMGRIGSRVRETGRKDVLLITVDKH